MRERTGERTKDTALLYNGHSMVDLVVAGSQTGVKAVENKNNNEEEDIERQKKKESKERGERKRGGKRMEAWLPPACLTHNIEEPPPPPPLLPIDILSAAEVVTYRPTKLRRKVSGGGGNVSSGSNCTGTICPKSVSHALIISAISNQQSFALDRQSQQQFWQPLVVVVVEVLYDDIVGPKGQQQSVRVCTQGATAEFTAAATVFPNTTTTTSEAIHYYTFR